MVRRRGLLGKLFGGGGGGGAGGGGRSQRVTFAYDPSGVRMTRQVTRDKPALRGDDVARAPPADGLWAEVRDASGTVLYRKALAEAIPRTTEVFEPNGRIRAVPYTPASGVFSVVVPIGGGAQEMLIMAGPRLSLPHAGLAPSPDPARAVPRALVRVPLGRP